MEENRTGPSNLVDTTDCLEAIGVFKGWKNLLFAVVVLCVVLLQASFWLVDVGYVKVDEEVKSNAVVSVEAAKDSNESLKPIVLLPDGTSDTAKQATTKADESAKTESKRGKIKFVLPVKITFSQLSWSIRLLNFVLIPVAALYCLTLLFCLKVSMIGRLGGINHIARAFFLSLTMLVFLLPWQRFFDGMAVGAMYSPDELLTFHTCTSISGASCDIFAAALYYLRFVGYGALILLLLILAQFRSTRWAGAILRRLEVI